MCIFFYFLFLVCVCVHMHADMYGYAVLSRAEENQYDVFGV